MRACVCMRVYGCGHVKYVYINGCEHIHSTVLCALNNCHGINLKLLLVNFCASISPPLWRVRPCTCSMLFSQLRSLLKAWLILADRGRHT